jgi:hypothetical protein
LAFKICGLLVKFIRVKSQVQIQQMADGDHIFGEIYLSYQPKIQLSFQEVISANQIESSLGIGEFSLSVPGESGFSE